MSWKNRKAKYRKRAGKRVFRRGRLQYQRNKKGLLKVTRKTYDVAMASAGPAGTMAQFDQTPGATCLTLGTPVLSNGASSTTNYDVPFTLKFRLNHLINHGDITAIADQYKIAATYIRVIYNKSESSPAFQGYMPYIEYISDFDDSVPPSINAMREKMGVKTKALQSNKFVKIYLTPKVHMDTNNVNGIQPRTAQWINSAFDQVDHYGIKGVIKGVYLPGTNTGSERITFDIVHKVLCKDIQ